MEFHVFNSPQHTTVHYFISNLTISLHEHKEYVVCEMECDTGALPLMLKIGPVVTGFQHQLSIVAD